MTDSSRGFRASAPSVEALRRHLVARIVDEVRETQRYLGKDALDERVIQAIGQVPRHEFVPESEEARAYDNAPLPIGHGQTISQPYIVAVMTDMLALRPDDRVLEIGTGCGYQAAVLAFLVRHVDSIEYVPELAARAAARLKHLGYDNIDVRAGDGWQGWPEHAPYDGVIVTAAAAKIPAALVAQLKPGRRLVVPVGPPHEHQDLMLVEKDHAGAVHERIMLPVAFVPLRGG